ncbi:MAG: hypothetical protein AAF945_09675 [Actinomycetota bacterium]
MRLAPALVVASLALAASACGDDEASEPADDTSITAERCVVYLHGKGGGGSATSLEGDVALVRPTGNDEGWGAREWRYFPDDRLVEATETVGAALDAVGCIDAVVHGFSNGGAFVGALACSGETFDGRVETFVVDDPVVDDGTADCSPAAGVGISLYWTGGLDAESVAGTDCGDLDWTCAGDVLVGLDEYAARLGVEPQPSRFDEHVPYEDPPEIVAFLG